MVLAGVEGDRHAIPLMMVADGSSAGGFEVIHPGPVPVVVVGPAVTSDAAARRPGADGRAADATTAVDVFASVAAAR